MRPLRPNAAEQPSPTTLCPTRGFAPPSRRSSGGIVTGSYVETSRRMRVRHPKGISRGMFSDLPVFEEGSRLCSAYACSGDQRVRQRSVTRRSHGGREPPPLWKGRSAGLHRYRRLTNGFALGPRSKIRVLGAFPRDLLSLALSSIVQGGAAHAARTLLFSRRAFSRDADARLYRACTVQAPYSEFLVLHI
jgi:hypothetical protein